MQNNNDVSRRNFLQMAAAASGAGYLKIGGAALAAITQAACAAEQASGEFHVLGDSEARDFAAIAARIIPTTETPGATEAGVIYFFDNAFAAGLRNQLAPARSGLETFRAALQAAGHSGIFGALDEAQQDEFLRSQENSNFFRLVRDMTIFGFFAMSSYGGNRDQVGWDLVGFAGHHGAWTYPFGYYDAEYAKQNADGQ